MVEMLEKKNSKLDGSEANDKTDADADNEKDGNKDTDSVSKSDADGTNDGCDGDKKPAAVDKKGVAWDTASEATVQEFMVGSLYIDKVTVVVEELDILYGVEPTDTVMQQEYEDREDDLVLDEMHAAGDHDDEDDMNGGHASESDWI
jgi:hypothetical protein